MADAFVDQQQRVVAHHAGVQLAFAGHPGAELERQFDDAGRCRQGGDDVEQDLEADRRQVAQRFVKHLPPQHEETAHRVRHFGFQHHLAEFGGEVGHAGAPGVPLTDAAAGHVAAADGDIGAWLAIFALQRCQHARQHGFVVLHVAVHRRHIGCEAGLCALDEGAGQAAAADAVDHADS